LGPNIWANIFKHMYLPSSGGCLLPRRGCCQSCCRKDASGFCCGWRCSPGKRVVSHRRRTTRDLHRGSWSLTSQGSPLRAPLSFFRRREKTIWLPTIRQVAPRSLDWLRDR
jgi:hypothetical protein